MKFKDENTSTPIKLTDSMIKTIYTKLCTKCDYQKLNSSNRDRGCYNESHDYVQETLITLLNKIKNNKVQFYSTKALFAWCNRTLNMLLMRYHRDYTIVQSRTAKLVDYSGESQIGVKNEDKISKEVCKDSSLPEFNLCEKEFQNYILAYTFTNAEIVPLNELYKVNAECTLLNLAVVFSSIISYGTKIGLRQFKIHKYTQPIIIDAITCFLKDYGFELESILPSKCCIKSKELGSREKDLLAKVKIQSNKNDIISIEELKEFSKCLNSSYNL